MCMLIARMFVCATVQHYHDGDGEKRGAGRAVKCDDVTRCIVHNTFVN
jgi:hypothetical protein